MPQIFTMYILSEFMTNSAKTGHSTLRKPLSHALRKAYQKNYCDIPGEGGSQLARLFGARAEVGPVTRQHDGLGGVQEVEERTKQRDCKSVSLRGPVGGTARMTATAEDSPRTENESVVWNRRGENHPVGDYESINLCENI